MPLKTVDDWRSFMKIWSVVMLSDPDFQNEFTPEQKASGWLGREPASEDEIRRNEVRLGVRLPPSYRTFLAMSNGWESLDNSIGPLWSVAEVERFPVRHQDWIDGWEDPYGKGIPEPGEVPDHIYFNYSEQQCIEGVRTAYLRTALDISPVGDSCILLLNPEIVTPEGEWEAWFFANWLPGAVRRPSFAELMEHEFVSYCRLQKIDPSSLMKI